MQEEAKYLLKVSATSEKPKARPLSLALRAPVGREQGEQWRQDSHPETQPDFRKACGILTEDKSKFRTVARKAPCNLTPCSLSDLSPAFLLLPHFTSC